jgi:hypothetical protein
MYNSRLGSVWSHQHFRLRTLVTATDAAMSDSKGKVDGKLGHNNGKILDTALAHTDQAVKLLLNNGIVSKLMFALAVATAGGQGSNLQMFWEAQRSEYWLQWENAIASKHNSLFEMEMFGPNVDKLPPGHKAIDAKLVFKTKHKFNSAIAKHKVHLVAKGYLQIPGIDFTDTFAPVVKLTSLHILCALAVCFKLHFHQLDVETMYLHRHLNKELYICLPPGFGPKSGQIQQLCCMIYRHKQAGCVWDKPLHSELVKLGYK